MKAEQPEVIFNLYDWLPSYGESRIKVDLEKNNLSLDIYYDSKEDDIELKKTLYFSDVCYFVFSSIPGIELMKINYTKSKDLGSLIEYKVSDAAIDWNNHFKNRNNEIKHFMLFFLSENKRIEVFAKKVITY